MTESLTQVISKIQIERKKLEELYTSKGHIDYEVLKQSYKLDRLINKYFKMVDTG
jgi:Spo0E like sporulation regulatory protein